MSVRSAILPIAVLVFTASGKSAPGPLSTGEIRLPRIFGDHMVLQRDREVPIFGKADPGVEVLASIDGKSVKTKTGPEGRFTLLLPAHGAGGPFNLELRTSTGAALVLHDLLFGEVWLCSGQSNMTFALRKAKGGAEAIAGSEDPEFRLFTVKREASMRPRSDCEGEWVRAGPRTAPGFSAVAFFFGRELRRALRVPVGLIHASWGGTAVEAWTSLPSLEGETGAREMLRRWKTIDERWPARRKEFDRKLAAWRLAVGEARKKGRRPPRKPRPPLGPEDKNHPAVLYNGMIHPIRPFAIRGVIWYQGERNASRPSEYRALFPLLIRDWRRLWSLPPFASPGDRIRRPRTFPFLYVQLAAFEAGSRDWAELRDAQASALSLPETGMATAIDVGNPRNIHPIDKETVGHRLALLIRAKVYGERDLVCTGPVLSGVKRKGKTLVLSFRSIGSGLVAKHLPMTGFEIAGRDRRFRNAEARIEGDTVVLTAEGSARPKYARYLWSNAPKASLYNAEGLPAFPFRTDR